MKKNTSEYLAVASVVFASVGIPLYFILRYFISLSSNPVITASIQVSFLFLSFLLFKLADRKNSVYKDKWAFWSIVIFSMYILLRWIVATQITKLDHLLMLYAMVYFWIPYFLIMYISDIKSISFFNCFIALISVILAILSYYVWATGQITNLTRYQIVPGFNYKSQAILLGFGVIYYFIKLLHTYSAKFLWILIFLFIPFFLSGSRSALIAVFLIVFLYYVKFNKIKIIQMFTLVSLLFLGYELIIAYMPEKIMALFFSKDEWIDSESGVGVLERIDVINYYFTSWFSDVSAFFFGKGSEINTNYTYAHNVIAQLFGEFGLVGAILYFAYFFYIMFRFYNKIIVNTNEFKFIIPYMYVLYAFITMQFGSHFLTVGYFWASIAILHIILILYDSGESFE